MNPTEKFCADLKEFFSNSNDQILHAIRSFSELFTPEKCKNLTDHFVNQTIPRIISNSGYVFF